jgi:hypothetical protein
MEPDESASRADQQRTGVSAVERAKVRVIRLRPGQQDQVGLQVEVDPTAGRTGIGRSLSDSVLQVFEVECQLRFSCTTFAANLASYYTETRAEASLSRADIGHTASISARMPGNRPESGCTTRPHDMRLAGPLGTVCGGSNRGPHTRPSRHANSSGAAGSRGARAGTPNPARRTGRRAHADATPRASAAPDAFRGSTAPTPQGPSPSRPPRGPTSAANAPTDATPRPSRGRDRRRRQARPSVGSFLESFPLQRGTRRSARGGDIACDRPLPRGILVWRCRRRTSRSRRASSGWVPMCCRSPETTQPGKDTEPISNRASSPSVNSLRSETASGSR